MLKNKDIPEEVLFDIEMQSYMRYNDTIASMYEWLGEIYSLQDIKDVEKAQKDIETLTNNYNDLVEMSDNKITKLQQENEDLKEWLNNMCFDGWNENVELALRYLLRIGYISFDEETREYINHNINDPICFGEEGRKYNDLLDKLDLENQDYKSRIDKVSNKIKTIFKEENWYENYEYNDLERALKEIDCILKEGDKE